MSVKTMVSAPRSFMEHARSMFSVSRGAWGVPLERPRLASWRVVMDILGVFYGFAFRLKWSSRESYKIRFGAKQGPGTPPESL